MNKAGTGRPAILQSDFASCSDCASRSKTSSNMRKTQASFAAPRMKRVGNDRGKPRRSSEPELKASLGKRLASVDDHLSETFDYRATCVRWGLASA
jgi:hypothetical protein